MDRETLARPVFVAFTDQRKADGSKVARFRCHCGNEFFALPGNVRRGTTISCGCFRRANSSAIHKGQRPAKAYVDRQQSSINALYSSYRTGAKNRGLSFELTPEEFKAIVKKDCVYCGAAPTARSKRCSWFAEAPVVNGIDRLNSSKGYCPENVVPCCTQCNYAKRDTSFDDFTRWLNRIAVHRAGAV